MIMETSHQNLNVRSPAGISLMVPLDT